MKTELSETFCKLIPETEWDKQALSAIRKAGVESVQFEDEWNNTGPLVLNFPDREAWGS